MSEKPIIALYVDREDGDADFLLAVDSQKLEMLDIMPDVEEWVDNLAEELTCQGYDDTEIRVECLLQLPEVLSTKESE